MLNPTTAQRKIPIAVVVITLYRGIATKLPTIPPLSFPNPSSRIILPASVNESGKGETISSLMNSNEIAKKQTTPVSSFLLLTLTSFFIRNASPVTSSIPIIIHAILPENRVKKSKNRNRIFPSELLEASIPLLLIRRYVRNNPKTMKEAPLTFLFILIPSFL